MPKHLFIGVVLGVMLVGSATGEIQITASFAASPDWESKLIEEDGQFRNGDGSSFIDVTTREDGHRVELFLATDDAASPQFQVSMLVSGEKWVDLDFLPGGGEGFFNPYNLPFNEDWTWLRHILPPSDVPYFFSKILIDEGCTFNFEPCSETKTGEMSYHAREITPPLPGDANLDGRVGFEDFLRLSANFGDDIFHEPRPGWLSGDFDIDGVPDMDDFLVLSANYGRTQEDFAAVPEPSGWPVCLGAFAVLLTRQRRGNVGDRVVEVGRQSQGRRRDTDSAICQCTAWQSVPTGQRHVAAGFNLRCVVRRDISPNGMTAIRKTPPPSPRSGLGFSSGPFPWVETQGYLPRSLQDQASCAGKHIVEPLSAAHCGTAVPSCSEAE